MKRQTQAVTPRVKSYWIGAWLWCISVGAILAVPLPLGVPGQWQWYLLPMESLETHRLAILLLLLLCFAFEPIVHASSRIGYRRACTLILGLSLFVRVFCAIVASGPYGGPRIYWSLIIASPVSTSFFLEARRIEEEGIAPYLREYHRDLASRPFHSATHPPGLPFLFAGLRAVTLHPSLTEFREKVLSSDSASALSRQLEAVMTHFMPDRWKQFRSVRPAELQSACLIAVFFLCLNLVAIFLWFCHLQRLVTDDRKPLLALLTALTPGTLFWMPATDSLHFFLSVMQLMLFSRWAGRGPSSKSWLIIVGFGLIAGVSILFAFKNGLSIACLLLWGFWLTAHEEQSAAKRRRLFELTAAVLVVVAIFLLLRLIWGFQPILTLREAAEAHSLQAGGRARSYIFWVLLNWVDWFLSIGALWLPLILAHIHYWWLSDKGPALSPSTLFVLVMLDLIGVVRGETARLWLPLHPMVTREPARLLPSLPLSPRGVITVSLLMTVALSFRVAWLTPW